MNVPTIANPSRLRLMFSNPLQKDPDRFSLRGDQSSELDRADDQGNGD
jgi:hypothetical protein